MDKVEVTRGLKELLRLEGGTITESLPMYMCLIPNLLHSYIFHSCLMQTVTGMEH